MKDDIVSQWEENALAYSELIGGKGTPHHQEILNPCVEELMGDVEGLNVLDAGCGEGYLSRHYARKGAHVTGIDVSSRLIELSKEKTDESLSISYRTDDVCSMKTIMNAFYDKVLCNLVLLNVPCLEDALNEFNRALKPRGELVISLVHPAFDFYGPGEWELDKKDPDTNRRRGRYFKIDEYFKETEYSRYWKTRDGERFPEPIVFYHRTFSTYFSALKQAGFVVEELREPLPITESEYFDRERRIPFFLVVKAAKTELVPEGL
ncbi:class I SAM-dependent methyltransferase [Candidatus Thorarchaeota archaeon]|nr:MAG: class I SAM-dependent methyltransferase [Candidatus Thorarchaeota archaeon]